MLPDLQTDFFNVLSRPTYFNMASSHFLPSQNRSAAKSRARLQPGEARLVCSLNAIRTQLVSTMRPVAETNFRQRGTSVLTNVNMTAWHGRPTFVNVLSRLNSVSCDDLSLLSRPQRSTNPSVAV